MSTMLARFTGWLLLAMVGMLACTAVASADPFPFGGLADPDVTYTPPEGNKPGRLTVTGTLPGPSGRKVKYIRPYTLPSPGPVLAIIVGGGISITRGRRVLDFIPADNSWTEAPTATAGPSPRASGVPFSVPIANDADVHDVACDERFAVIAGANSPTPVSLVDVAQQREVSTVSIPGRLGRAVSIGDDGRTVLVVLDDPVNNTTNSVRRLVLEPNGTLTDTGESLAFGAEYVTKVRVAPGSKVGVALVGIPTRIVSFAVPGLAARGSVALTGGTGNAVDFSPAGDRVYARSGRRAATPDVIEGFAFDPVTGAIGQVAAPRIANVSGFTGPVYLNPMAISTSGARIVAAEENATGELPNARIAYFDARTGALADTMTDADIGHPQTVATLRPCSVPATTGTAVEFYNAALDHYFITWMAAEIAKLDAGVEIKGWTRTEKSFGVYTSAQAASSPVCRYYIPPGLGDSHFFGRGTVECNATGKNNPTFVLEDAAFMHMILPTAGVCPASTSNVYRVFSNRPDANHRYMTDKATRDAMVAKGWLAEGDGPDLVVMCAPAAATP